MKSLRVVFLLSITIITITWASCKKDKTGNGDMLTTIVSVK